MKVSSDKDFAEIRMQMQQWRKRFPMFRHDITQIENIIEKHIKEYSKHLVQYRQTKKKHHLENAANEIDAINRTLLTVEKIELMAMLSR